VSNNTGTAWGWVVAPVTTTITQSTEAAVTSSATWGSTDGSFDFTNFAVCAAQSGTAALFPLTDTLYADTSDFTSVSLSAALVENGTWDVGLCSHNDTPLGAWYAGSTTVVTGDYVPSGFAHAAKVQPPVHSGPPPRIHR
jgi:hypothetical protein